MKNKKLWIILLLILAVIITVIIVVSNSGKRDSHREKSTDQNGNFIGNNVLSGTEKTDLPEGAVDAKEYFENSGEILSIVKANDSPFVQTEEQAVAAFAERGFKQAPIEYHYAMNGDYLSKADASESAEKHPMYQSWYVTEAGNVWFIYSINGYFIAFPAFYGEENDSYTVPLLFAEEDYLWSYDGLSNKFYKTKPDGSEGILVRIDAVNSETLEKLTKEEIDSLCAQQ